MHLAALLAALSWVLPLFQHVQSRQVFAHYMVGTVTEAHVRVDIDQAKDAGIHGFSLNVGVPSLPFVADTLRYMFDYAPTVGFHLHISMDIWASGDANGGHPELYNNLLKQYMHAPGYFTVNNLPYITTFSHGGLTNVNWTNWRELPGNYLDSKLTMPTFLRCPQVRRYPPHFFVPDFDGSEGYMQGADGWWWYWGDVVDGVFTWETAWPVRPGEIVGSASQGSIETDLVILKSARSRGKLYNIPVSSLQYKNAYSTTVYREGDLNLIKRMGNILQLGPDLAPDFVTILTWNDGPEGHYVGNIWPEQNNDAEPARYVTSAPRWDHWGWLSLIKSFSAAYMTGGPMLPEFDQGIAGAMWYSSVMKSSICPPGTYVTNWEAGGDQVNWAIVVSTKFSNLEVHITSGHITTVYPGMGPGANYAATAKNPGQQLLEVFSGGIRIAMAQGGRCVSSQCPDNIYNMNPIVVPIVPPDSAPSQVSCEDPLCANPGLLQLSLRQPNVVADRNRSSRAFRALRDPVARQSEDYNYYALIPNRINTELMVGPMDGNGNRATRENCIFYVNQRDLPRSHPDFARTRAIQFGELMNAAYGGGDYHTLYNVYDEAAFDETMDPQLSADRSGNQRNWFRITSAQYASLCTGTVYLIVEEEPAEIWDGSIWITHEWPRIRDGFRVNQVLEITPQEIGRVLDAGPGAIRYITRTLYRGGQPRGATPPRDGGSSEVPACVDIDGQAAVQKYAGFPDVGSDSPPFNEGICTMHVHQWNNAESGGGGPFDDPTVTYSVEVTLFDDGAAHKIGFLERTNAPVTMVSKLDQLFVVTPVQKGDYIQFQLGTQTFRSNDGSCSVGGWDHGKNRQMDCGFSCLWGGGDLTDRTLPGVFYP
ncbi:Glucan endo-alpha-glucosidase agn1 [Mycena venus]|uniref:Glucan endo-alpha-glucosidase agn1 n=1 Tax=Mycena venus TaxID=2733690 RepID=A0A8H7CI80_9AGAR|nr:Glucan endo-alpha-glucosidase agn1 [Mycena venus]